MIQGLVSKVVMFFYCVHRLLDARRISVAIIKLRDHIIIMEMSCMQGFRLLRVGLTFLFQLLCAVLHPFHQWLRYISHQR